MRWMLHTLSPCIVSLSNSTVKQRRVCSYGVVDVARACIPTCTAATIFASCTVWFSCISDAMESVFLSTLVFGGTTYVWSSCATYCLFQQNCNVVRFTLLLHCLFPIPQGGRGYLKSKHSYLRPLEVSYSVSAMGGIPYRIAVVFAMLLLLLSRL